MPFFPEINSSIKYVVCITYFWFACTVSLAQPPPVLSPVSSGVWHVWLGDTRSERPGMVLFSVSLLNPQSPSSLSALSCSRFTHVQDIDDEAVPAHAALQTSVFIGRQAGSQTQVHTCHVCMAANSLRPGQGHPGAVLPVSYPGCRREVQT